MGDFPYLDYLAQIYREKATGTKDWRDYLRAHGLANACLARHPTVERQQLVYEIERLWYDGDHPLSYEKHQKLTESHKDSLINFRLKTAKCFGSLDSQHEELPTDASLAQTNINQWFGFAKNIFASSAKCTQGFIDYSHLIIKSSVECVLASKSDNSPCPFAVIGFGSVARGEATPFSDLEYGFIVQRHDDYFTRLAVDTYFRIGNLRESPLKCFNIPELTVDNNRSSIHFIDQPPVNGYKIDGISPKAGNIPTGSGEKHGKKLILTVDGFMIYYESALMAEADPKIPGDMADLMSSSVLLFANEGGERLYHDFLKKRARFEQEKAACSIHAKKKRLSTIESDIVNHKFLPEFDFNRVVEHTSVKVKADIFRYPTLLCTNLRIILNLDTQYPWETLDSLNVKGILSQQNHSLLTIVLGISIFLRTGAYLSLGTQQDYLSLFPKMEVAVVLDDRFYIDRKVFFVLGCLLVPIKQSLSYFVRKAKTYLQRTTADFDSTQLFRTAFQDFQAKPDDFLKKAEIHHFMGDFEEGLKVITDAIGKEVLKDCVKYIEQVRKAYGTNKTDPKEKRSLLLCARLLGECDKHEEMLTYCMWLVTYSDNDIETRCWNKNAAECLVQVGKFKQACTLVDQVFASIRQELELKPHESLVDHAVKIVQKLNTSVPSGHIEHTSFLASVYLLQGLAKYKLSEENSCKLLLAESLNCFGYSELLFNTLLSIAVDSRFRLVQVLDYKSNAYRDSKEYVRGLMANLRQFDILKDLYGMNADVSQFDQFHSNIANTSYMLEEYVLGNFYIDIALVGTGNSPQCIADTYYLIGVAHLQEQQYTESLKYHMQALAMREQFPKSCWVSYSYMAVGNVYITMGNLGDAVRYYKMCLGSREGNYENEIAHIEISSTHDRLGLVYCEVGYFNQSCEHHLKALAINRFMKAHGTERQKRFADLHHSLCCVGVLAGQLGQFDRAHEYFSAAISHYSAGAKYIKLLLAISECRYFEKQYNYAIKFCILALKAHGSDQNPALAGQLHILSGQSFMMLDANRYRIQTYRHLAKACAIFEGMAPCKRVNMFLSRVFLSLAQFMFTLDKLKQASVYCHKSLDLTRCLTSGEGMKLPANEDVQNQAMTLLLITIIKLVLKSLVKV